MTGTQDLTKSTIMIIDDTVANLDLLQRILKSQGYTVLAFPKGDLAIRAALKNPPDLILLDITMPEMDGFEVCSRLKAEPSLVHIPVLFVSALSETYDKVKAFSIGGVDFVTKPFQVMEVNARVKTHLDLARMRRELEKYNFELEGLVQEKVKEIEKAHLSTILAMVKLAEYRDTDTGIHIERTRLLCRSIAENLRSHRRFSSYISDQYIEDIHNAAPLHDIGKVGIPDTILLKPGKLDADEFETMKTHTTIGAKALMEVQKGYVMNSFINMGVSIAQSHHEKWDGSGYPEGLKGEDIPLSARIMAVADVYDALRTRRPYKEPQAHEVCMNYLLNNSGSQFDPDIVTEFHSLGEMINRIY